MSDSTSSQSETEGTPTDQAGREGVVVETSADQTASGLSRSQQLFVVVVMSTTLILLLVHWVRLQGWGMSEVTINRPEEHQYDFKIDINQAGRVEWMQLDGIGEQKVTAILLERESNGPFTSLHDLTRVDGIGEKTLEKLRPWLLKPEPEEPADLKNKE